MRCFGDPKRLEAPAARMTAITRDGCKESASTAVEVCRSGHNRQGGRELMAVWRRNDERTIEARLRSARPVPPPHLVERISHSVVPRTARRLRFALAAAITVGLVAMLGAFGGIGYAGSSVKQVTGVVKVVKNAFGVEKANRARSSARVASADEASSSNQYEEKVTICHVPPGNPNNPQTLTLSSSGAAAHLRNHPDDTMGACANSKHGGGRH
jgi:hypothetical protein